MRAAVVGGTLQGVEAVYLAHKAGWEVLLIDKKPLVPASGLCDTFVQLDVTRTEQLDSIFKDVDLVIPATENSHALNSLVQWSRGSDIPLAFDPVSYGISSSKRESDRLFAVIGVPAPLPWPGCGFPLIVKPVSGSGSEGVRLFHNRKQLENFFSTHPIDDWVLQEYLAGPSYSLEITGSPGSYTTLQVTDLEMDQGYDCKRVLAPTQLLPEQVTQLEQISLKIAQALPLKGLMDVEVIVSRGKMKVLEIDARLPSQTPTAVYWSGGINMLELLGQCFPVASGAKNLKNKKSPPSEKGVVYEHIKVTHETLEVCGEHIMTDGGPLRLRPGFFEADEAITNYSPGQTPWTATLINSGATLSQAREKRHQIIKNIRDHFKLKIIKDRSPKKVAMSVDNDYNSPRRPKANKKRLI